MTVELMAIFFTDLRQNAIIIGWYSYNAAIPYERFPRKPKMKFKHQRPKRGF